MFVLKGKKGTFEFEGASPAASLCLPIAERFPHISAQPADTAKPAFLGTVDEFVAKVVADRPELADLMKLITKNRVRRCACGKSVAYTLPACNSCGSSLAGVPVSYTDNVFTSFIFGLEKCSLFPLTISSRLQTEHVIVFDDLLSLSCCHLNAVPTDDYIMDWRFLLKRPTEGLAVIRRLRSSCERVVREQFLTDKAWRKKVFALKKEGDSTREYTDDEILECAMTGLNLPPSQFQLHLQFILPPMIPYQHFMLLSGNHYTKGRFFPFEFIADALEAVAKDPSILAGLTIDDSTSLDDILPRLSKCAAHVDYDEYHARMNERAIRGHDMLCNWTPEDFGGFLVGDKVYKFTKIEKKDDDTYECHYDKDSASTADLRSLTGADKKILQNYGRPYTADTDKPTGTYYKYAKDPAKLTVW